MPSRAIVRQLHVSLFRERQDGASIESIRGITAGSETTHDNRHAAVGGYSDVDAIGSPCARWVVANAIAARTVRIFIDSPSDLGSVAAYELRRSSNGFNP